MAAKLNPNKNPDIPIHVPLQLQLALQNVLNVREIHVVSNRNTLITQNKSPGIARAFGSSHNGCYFFACLAMILSLILS